MQTFLANLLRSTSILTALFLAACGGGGGSGVPPVAPTPAATYSVSATVTGLQPGQFVTILDNGGSGSGNTATANGAVTLATTLDSGDSYNVTVGTQPAVQTCNVVDGAGAIGTADVTNVQVNCGALFAYVANISSNNVSAYTIDAVTGALTQVTGSPFAAGTYPLSITVGQPR